VRILLSLLILVPACRPSLTATAPPAADAKPAPFGPVVRVLASYPGANARVVADTVVGPLFAQINGVEGAVSVEAEARNDGSCEITIRFGPKVEVALARTLLQNRVALADPMLPTEVRRLGIALDHRDPDRTAALWVVVRGRPADDALLLAGVARGPVTAALYRVPGIDGVRVIGPPARLRVVLDPDRLAALSLTAGDVATALEKQNVRVEAGPGVFPPVAGKPVAFTLSPNGRVAAPDDLGGVVVHTAAGNKPILLRDVGRVEVAGAAGGGFANLNKDTVALVSITAAADAPTAEQVRKALSEITGLPEGVRAEVFADLRAAASRVVMVELQLPTRPRAPGRSTRPAGRGDFSSPSPASRTA